MSKKRKKIKLSKVKSKAKNKEPRHIYSSYHTLAFYYFHALLPDETFEPGSVRKEFFHNIPNGTYGIDEGQKLLTEYKNYLNAKLQKVISKYDVSYWMHVSRRIRPSNIGEDKQRETIAICRTIIVAAIQKYALQQKSTILQLSTTINPDQIFKGLFLKPAFALHLKEFTNPDHQPQWVLTDFDERNLEEYYNVEKCAYELWLVGAKSRIIAKGANLIINNNLPQILLDDRSDELEFLINIYDSREHPMVMSATGTVFRAREDEKKGYLLLPQIYLPSDEKKFSNYITEYIELEFPKGQFPNYDFVIFDIRTYFHTHLSFADDFAGKWNVRLEFVIMILTDLGISLIQSILGDKDVAKVIKLMQRGYVLYKDDDYLEWTRKNWATTNHYLGTEIGFDKDELIKAFNFLTLKEEDKNEIFLDSFGPLKVFVPSPEDDGFIVDYSVIGEVLHNLFHQLPFKDRGFKGELLEKTLEVQPSYLPTTESKGNDGTSKQVDYSFANGEILVLAECKAVARSFGIFTGQARALEHRLQNVIHKGLNDVDSKIAWFLQHPTGRNYDISKFKYLLGVAVSPFPEFIPSRDKFYWLNNQIPRVLTIDEFHELMKTDLSKTIIYNLVPVL